MSFDGPPPPPPAAPPPPSGGSSSSSTPQVRLPAGVTLASPGRRVVAYFVSILLVFVTCGIGWLIWGLIVWGKGTSPALQVLGMRAWKHEEDRPAQFSDMLLRNVPDYLIATLTCGIAHIVSFVMFLTEDPTHRTIADRIGSTVIVEDPHKVLR